MERGAPIRPMTRLTMLGQVIAIAWVVPAVVASVPLQGRLGHVSGVVLFPLMWQVLFGALLHGALVVLARSRSITSFPLCLAIGVMATFLVLAKLVLQRRATVSDFVDQLMPVVAILLAISLASAMFGWFLTRRELRHPSLG